MPQKGREGEVEEGQIHEDYKDYKNKTNCAFFFSGVQFFLATAMLIPEQNS